MRTYIMLTFGNWTREKGLAWFDGFLWGDAKRGLGFWRVGKTGKASDGMKGGKGLYVGISLGPK